MRLVPLAVLLLLAGAGPARAQDPTTFDRAVALALDRNPVIRAARAAAEGAAAGVTDSRSAAFPRLSFSASARRGDQPVFVFGSLLAARRFDAAAFAIDALNRPDSVTFYQRTVGIDLVLVDFGRTRASVRAAERLRDMANAGVRQAAGTIVASVAEAYGRLLSAEAGRRAAQAAVASATEDVARAGHRRDAGTASEADVLSMQSHLWSMRERVIRASADATIARADLNRLMGATVDAPTAIVEPVLPPMTTASARDLLTEAERGRPELTMARASEGLAEAELDAARAGRLPQLAAQATAEQNGLSFADRSLAWTAGVELRWSMSLGGAEAARSRRAAAGLTRARADMDDRTAAVGTDVIAALARLQSAHARVATGLAAVDQAREGHRIIRDRYEAGLAAATDVLRASTALLDAETARVSALADALSAHAALDRAVGRMPSAFR